MRIKIVLLLVVATVLMVNVTNAQNDKQKQEVIILKKGNNEKQVTIKIDGDKMTINGEPVSDSIKNKFLNGNEGQTKTMKVIVNGESVNINGMPSKENFRTIDDKIIKGDKKQTMTVLVERDSAFIDGKPIDANERNIKFIKNGRTIITNDLNDSEIKEVRINRNHNFNLPEEFVMNVAQPKMMLGVMIAKVENGLIIKEVFPESAAALAGLKVDDIITKFNGTPLNELKQLVDSVQNKKPGESIVLMVIKAGEKKETSVTIKFNKKNATNKVSIFVEGEGPNDDGAVIEKDIQRQLHNIDLGNGMRKKRIYMQSFPPNKDFGEFKFQKPILGIHVQETKDSSGVTVLKVMKGSLAESAGIKENDIITSVDNKKIVDIQSSTTALAAIKEKESFQLIVRRNGKNINIVVKNQKKLKKAVL